MQLIVHVNGFYEWVEVPADVPRDNAEWKRAVKAGKIKPATNSLTGSWLMHVPKTADTHTFVAANEDDIIQCIIQEMTRGDRRHLTRVEAATRLVARHTLHHHSHASNVEEVQMFSDDGPDEALFRKRIQEHIDCHNIDPLDFDGLLEAYMTPAAQEDHIDALHAHFNVKPKKLEAFRAKRLEKEATLAAAHQHHLARLEAAKKDKEVDQ